MTVQSEGFSCVAATFMVVIFSRKTALATTAKSDIG
jgi:hypothetical protein